MVVFVHGGGWWKGDSKISPTQAPILDELRDRGYNVVSANYRLAGPTHNNLHWPAPENDLVCLYNFLATHPKYGDAMKLGGWGHSAGAHLTLMAALTDPSTWYADCDWSGTFHFERVAVTSAPTDLTKNTSGAYYATTGLMGIDVSATLSQADIDALLAASPITYASASDPPVLLLTGADDTLLIPADNSGALQAAFAAVGVTATWTNYPGADHDGVYDPTLTTAQDDIASFFPTLPHSRLGSDQGCASSY